jgi:hypothetical protein
VQVQLLVVSLKFVAHAKGRRPALYQPGANRGPRRAFVLCPLGWNAPGNVATQIKG